MPDNEWLMISVLSYAHVDPILTEPTSGCAPNLKTCEQQQTSKH